VRVELFGFHRCDRFRRILAAGPCVGEGLLSMFCRPSSSQPKPCLAHVRLARSAAGCRSKDQRLQPRPLRIPQIARVSFPLPADKSGGAPPSTLPFAITVSPLTVNPARRNTLLGQVLVAMKVVPAWCLSRNPPPLDGPSRGRVGRGCSFPPRKSRHEEASCRRRTHANSHFTAEHDRGGKAGLANPALASIEGVQVPPPSADRPLHC
jgi:hypothetical protein